MKEKLNTQTISTLFPVLGLALLLLFSPCTVRNSVEAQLGVPPTDVINKSKATASAASCTTLQVSETVLSSRMVAHQHLPSLAACSGHLAFNVSYLPTALVYASASNTHTGAVVPLYILYQRLTVYL